MKKAFSVALFILLLIGESKGQIATFKYVHYDSQIFIKVRLNDETDTLNFIFDSGAGNTVIDLNTAKKIPSLSVDTGAGISATGAGGAQKVFLISNYAIIHLGNIQLGSVPMIAMDLLHLSEQFGRKIDGIIGYDLLKSFLTEMNTDDSTIYLYSFKDKIKAKYKSPLSFKFYSNIPIVQCAFKLKNGAEYSGPFLFDTGAGITAFINTPYVRANGLLKKSGSAIMHTTENLTTSSTSYDVRIRGFSIQHNTFNDLIISLTDVKEGVNAMKDITGILGNKIILRFNILFDYSNRRIYLSPGRQYETPFESIFSGLSFRIKDQKVLINSVVPQSVEERLGIIAGDELLSVNGNTTKEMYAIKKYFKIPGEKNIVVVRSKRNNEIATYKIENRKIL
ncbi:aspartyl protease family protein [Chitinophaga eiseniae]|uniref:PDZ domain-containing protein n=1 Tax=Chitinophaga eiseniae TaxID=634771 RepID=A0A847SIH8_9BACT|nr:aspartyl protease family protein [Chitinophaga eiseniae]NLR77168.1 hypothetical protein [Chitinophaga eiseniae]